jgi:hypothetical protein
MPGVRPCRLDLVRTSASTRFDQVPGHLIAGCKNHDIAPTAATLSGLSRASPVTPEGVSDHVLPGLVPDGGHGRIPATTLRLRGPGPGAVPRARPDQPDRRVHGPLGWPGTRQLPGPGTKSGASWGPIVQPTRQVADKIDLVSAQTDELRRSTRADVTAAIGDPTDGGGARRLASWSACVARQLQQGGNIRKAQNSRSGPSSSAGRATHSWCHRRCRKGLSREATDGLTCGFTDPDGRPWRRVAVSLS